jgi:hypothetical protein
MIQTLTHAGRWARLRAPMLALAVLAGACDSADNLATTDPTVPVEAATLDTAGTDSLTVTDSAVVDSAVIADSLELGDTLATDGSLEPTDLAEIEASEAAIRRSGVPFGPYGLWSGYTDLRPGAQHFSSSFGSTDPKGIIKQLNAARAKGRRLFLTMTGGPSTHYTTRGKFDFGKWKRRMNSFNTPAIRAAVRAAVADGTLILNGMLDDADVSSRWGVMTKPQMDNMARYVKSIFPTLPVSVNVQYDYRPHERFKVVDAIYSQYRWWRTSGNIKLYRDKALAATRREGVAVVFGMNILDGGIQNRKTRACPLGSTGGRGTYAPNCRMTATQVREWGKVLGQAGCALLMWKYDAAFISKPANVAAFKDVGATLARTSGKSCRRGRA